MYEAPQLHCQKTSSEHETHIIIADAILELQECIREYMYPQETMDTP